jgi:hypothetical protein
MAEVRPTEVRATVIPASWPVSWSAIWIGALAALAAGALFGLLGTAVGAYAETRVVDWHKFRLGALAFSVFGSFLSYAIGGWVAGKVRGPGLAEDSMLHGAVAWLVTIPILLVLAAVGATHLYGAWYGGLAGTPAWAPTVVSADPRAAIIARNGATAALTALLLGLVGSVIGGWMASGERMTFRHYRTRTASRRDP